MSDPIKAALEAASRAMVRADWNGAESVQEFESACWRDRHGEAAAAIAAFLRALPDDGRGLFERAAAAVERAAQEAAE